MIIIKGKIYVWNTGRKGKLLLEHVTALAYANTGDFIDKVLEYGV